MMMFFHWMQTHAMIMIFDVILFVLLVLYLCYTTIRFKKKYHMESPIPQPNKAISVSSHDIKAIAGDDVFATQLDLARAYIEMGKQKIAKQILDHVIKNGTVTQKQLAERLLVSL